MLKLNSPQQTTGAQCDVREKQTEIVSGLPNGPVLLLLAGVFRLSSSSVTLPALAVGRPTLHGGPVQIGRHLV